MTRPDDEATFRTLITESTSRARDYLRVIERDLPPLNIGRLKAFLAQFADESAFLVDLYQKATAAGIDPDDPAPSGG